MKTKKMRLEQLQVKSFVTVNDGNNQIKGGTFIPWVTLQLLSFDERLGCKDITDTVDPIFIDDSASDLDTHYLC